jgi:hypothetical protein
MAGVPGASKPCIHTTLSGAVAELTDELADGLADGLESQLERSAATQPKAIAADIVRFDMTERPVANIVR